MKENRYDDLEFFLQYSQMSRSVYGLEAAGEWHTFRKMLPPLQNKRVLDLGCGFGWHCRYAAAQGAASVVGIDLSARMLQEAHRGNLPSSRIAYIQMAIEDIDFPAASFDTVISSLAFHYVASLRKTYQRVYSCLSDAGDFVFSVEHPIFTSSDRQEWHYDSSVRRHWPVDNYYREGLRRTNFLGMDVTKYHRTLTSYTEGLLKRGFQITGLIEPRPDRNLATSDAEWKDELRRPMFLLLSARKA